jgi:hypothetical protein
MKHGIVSDATGWLGRATVTREDNSVSMCKEVGEHQLDRKEETQSR